jgi:hypothetical protein
LAASGAGAAGASVLGAGVPVEPNTGVAGAAGVVSAAPGPPSRGRRARRLYLQIVAIDARAGSLKRLKSAHADHLAVIGIEEETHPPPLATEP